MVIVQTRGGRAPGRRPRMARIPAICAAALLAAFTAPVLAQTPQIPQIPAFLPTVDQVPATGPMPLDGTWLVNTIRKKIRIEGGRAYAVDPWLHMFVLKVEPGMVVLRDIAPAAPGKYTGSDLPMMGELTATVQPDRSLAVSVATALMPVQYKLIPVQLDNPQWYAQEMSAAGIGAPQGQSPAPGAYQPAPPQQVYQPPPQQQQPVQRPYQPPPQQQQPGQQPYQPPPQQQQPGQQPYQAPAQQQPAYQPAPPPGGQQAPAAAPAPSQPAYQPAPASPAPYGAQRTNSGSVTRSRNRTQNDSFGPPDLTCGEDGAEPCGDEKKVDAEFVKEAENWGCKGKQLYLTPKNGGECWRCPSGYRRTVKPIHTANACKERGLGFGKDETDATFVRSAYGCPADTFESMGKCYECPAGSSKVAFLGAFNPGQACKTANYCDDGLKVQRAPPKALQEVGPPYNEVCGRTVDADDIIRLSRERMKAHQDLKIVAIGFVGELATDAELRQAIQRKDGVRAAGIIMRTPGFARLRDQARASGFDTLSFGGAPEVKVVGGAAQEAGFAMDWNGNPRFYMTTVVSTGASVSAGFSATFGLWNAPAGGIGGYARGASFSLPVPGANIGVAGGAVGGGAWFSYYPLDFVGLTYTVSGGIGLDTVDYNQAVTNVY